MKILIAGLVALSAPAIVMAQAETPGAAQSPMGPGNEAPAATASEAPSDASAETDRIRSALTEAGYTDVKNVKQTANGWTARATLNGQVQDLQINQDGTVTTTPVEGKTPPAP